MKTSEALKIVKGHVVTALGCPGVSHICSAASDAYLKRKINAEMERRIKDHIRVLLGPFSCSLGIWLLLEHKIRIVHSDEYEEYIKYFNKMQATRHAWIDSMIAEFQAKGD